MGIPHISQSAAEPTEAAEAQAELPDAWIIPRVLGTEWVLTMACDFGSQGRGHFFGWCTWTYVWVTLQRKDKMTDI